MNINNLGLLNSLAAIINEGVYDSDYSTTEYILHNIDNIQNITVNMIMDEAYVSRSAIRRFCNRLGYENFSVLKHSLSDIIFPSNIHLREFENIGSFRKKVTEGLSKMVTEINEIITDDIIDSLASLINEHEGVSMISANNISANLLKFQQELFYAKKIIKIVDNYFDRDEMDVSSRETNLIIVVSVSGIFAEAINDIIREVDGKKILITGSHGEEYKKVYDQIIYISKSDISDDKMGLYGKYGITYFFDLLSEHYIFTYKQ
ncbi:MurR/RpiR family transcriptional regulator [Carnobacterium sp. CS13]|uniref:MurR/RpiR family transcriptional regulator n=1 Tax=Carnobacterium sp. CS13 TaxID=2800128 RepID=UPI0019114835|nr:MurR/RpiR family transcriptional regulator [Carnobacterium sp. CS13]QQP70175.1 MurR/RpiR family transcriptional regulator [Carnobacterium sp. CS13]